MSVSTDALLVYGYIWDDEHDLFDGDDEWDKRIAKQRGVVNPWDAYPAEFEKLPYAERKAKGEEWRAANRGALDAWYAARKAISEEYGVEIDRHGSNQWSVPILKIAGAGFTAARGYPKSVTADNLTVDPTWDDKLRRFATDLGIDTSEAEGPGWFLASWWG
jgi:hypothetical protein